MLAALLLWPASTLGAQFTVDSTADAIDPSPGDNLCQVPCTIRTAIQMANAAAGPDEILFDPSLNGQALQLGIPGDKEDASATGDLDVTESLTITGNGAANTIVDGGDVDRVFDLRAGTVSITGVTIRNGTAAFRPPPNDHLGEIGGGLRTTGAAVVTVNDSVVTDNDVRNAGRGGGTSSDGTSTLTLNRTTVSSNRATSGVNGGGGGGVSEESAAVVVKIVDSLVTGNQAQYAAGVLDDALGRVEITRSTVSNNTTVPYDPTSPIQMQQGGGVVEAAGTVIITDSVISGNTATYGAGVVEEGGTLTITNSTISGNQAKAVTTPQIVNSSPDSNGAGGGLLQFSNGNLTVTGTTFSGNTADLNGGAIMIQGGGGGPTATVTNSTFSGNTAGTGGGAIRSERRALSVVNSTLDGNSAPNGANVNLCSGGPQVNPSFCQGTVTLRNSIVSGGSSGANCAVAQGTLTSAGNNIDSGTSCGFAAAGDMPATDPKLAPLANYGGLTQTKALYVGSPALDAATGCPATDQRGIGRPVGPACDIGAFEGSIPVPVANDDSRTVGEDSGPTDFTVLANDSNTTDVTSVSDPAHGTTTVVDGSPDQVRYTPDADYCNEPGAAPTDDFSYTVPGGDTATVAVTVTCVDDPPVAQDDAWTVVEDSGATPLAVLANDSDPDGEAVEITAVGDPANGSASVVQGSPDQVRYTPDADYCNEPGAAPTDDFAYTVNGGDTATVAVTVTCVDDPVRLATPGPGPTPDPASPDTRTAAARPSCLTIAGVVRDQRAAVPGGGQAILSTRQVDDPARPLRLAVRLTGSQRIRSVAFRVNGRTVPAAAGTPVTQDLLRLGGSAVRNQITATVVLTNGRRIVLTQFMIVLKCSTPVTSCARLAGGRTLRCTSRTPLGGRRVRITASRTSREVATGTATVTRGRYTAILRSPVALSAGTYAYKHVVTTGVPRQRYYMIRTVRVT
jgi:predicted outer membrane repeat protein